MTHVMTAETGDSTLWLEIHQALTALDGNPVADQLAARCLSIATTPTRPRDVLEAVSSVSQCTVTSLIGITRRRDVVRARHVAMFIMRRDLKLSLPDIGRAIGRDHTTALYGIDRVKRELNYGDAETCRLVNTTRARLANTDMALL